MAVELEQTRAHLERRDQMRRDAARERAKRLLAKLPDAAQLLRAYGARRIVLFGSLAEGTPSDSSDVDLAVEGLSPSAYFPVLAQLMALFRGPVDLVRVEEATPGLRQRIEDAGRPL